MSKLRLLLILFVMMLLTGCAQQAAEEEKGIQERFKQEPAEAEEEEQVQEAEEEEQVQEPEEEPAPEETEEPLEEELTLSEEFTELLEKANSKVTSMRYVYYGPPEQQKAASFVVKDDKMKVSYAKLQQDEEMEYDTVYIDIKAKTAEGYCKDNTCKDKETSVSVDFDEHYKETPLEKINQVVSAELSGEENVDDVKNIIFNFKNNKGEEGRIWVGEFRGIVRKIETTTPEETKTEYTVVSANNVKDEELTP